MRRAGVTSMNFTFLHIADLHLGSPFLGLAIKDEPLAKKLAAASREAFTELVSRAIALEVAFVVIAGDIYDGEWRDNSIGLFFNKEISRLARAGIQIYTLRGNHDAESEVTKTISLPPKSVREFSTRSAETVLLEDLRVAIHGRGFPNRAVPENYALDYPPPKPGWFNIGVLHTSGDGHPNHATYAPCTVAELVSRGYQYWALGHVHDYKILSENPWIVYPGNLQGRTIRECGAKGGVVVEVGDGEVKDVQRLIVDRARWAIVDVDAAGIEGEADLFVHIEEAIQDALEECPLLLIRVRITGATELNRAFRAKLPEVIQEVQARADHCREDIWVESVILGTTEIINLEAAGLEASSDAEEANSSLDLSTALDPLLDAPETLAAAKELSNLLRSKLPGGIDAEAILSGSAMNTLLLEARDTLLSRALS